MTQLEYCKYIMKKELLDYCKHYCDWSFEKMTNHADFIDSFIKK